MRVAHCITLLVGTALLGACGGTSSSGGGAGCAMTATASIAAAGVTPKAICVVPGGSVTFTNGDTAQHNMAVTGTSCPAGPGLLNPGASGTATFPTATACQFHDALAPTNTAFQGNIAVNAAPPPGY